MQRQRDWRRLFRVLSFVWMPMAEMDGSWPAAGRAYASGLYARVYVRHPRTSALAHDALSRHVAAVVQTQLQCDAMQSVPDERAERAAAVLSAMDAVEDYCAERCAGAAATAALAENERESSSAWETDFSDFQRFCAALFAAVPTIECQASAMQHRARTKDSGRAADQGVVAADGSGTYSLLVSSASQSEARWCVSGWS